MAVISIQDLDLNEELDSNALENIFGGRWVRRRYYRRVVRWVVRRRRVVTYRYTRVRRTYLRAYTTWRWV